MGAEALLKPLVDMPRMADEDRAMLHDALDAYVARDVTAARAVAARDDVVDNWVVNIAERAIFMSSGELRELNAGPNAPVNQTA